MVQALKMVYYRVRQDKVLKEYFHGHHEQRRMTERKIKL
jgi:hypothetical protein